MSEHSKGPELTYYERSQIIRDADGNLRANIHSKPGAPMVSVDPETDALGRKMAASLELEEALREMVLWVGATAELLATIPRPSGPDSRKLLDAIEGGRAWASDGSTATVALEKAGMKP